MLRQEEKEVSRLNESLQMMHIKYVSRENIFRTLQEKIRESEQACKNFQQKIKDLENQLVEEKQARSQLNLANETSRSFQPSFKQRLPLARITNLPPPLAPPHKIVKTGLENKENAHSTIKDVTKGFTTKPLGKATRLTLAPIVFNISKNKRRGSCATEGLENMENAHSTIKDVTEGFTTKPHRRAGARRLTLAPVVFNISKNKRRGSCATEGLETLAQLFEKHHMNHTRVTTKPSQLRIIPRRRSVATLIPLQVTPEVKGKCIRSFKYPSTLQLQTLWKSKIPSGPSPFQ